MKLFEQALDNISNNEDIKLETLDFQTDTDETEIGKDELNKIDDEIDEAFVDDDFSIEQEIRDLTADKPFTEYNDPIDDYKDPTFNANLDYIDYDFDDDENLDESLDPDDRLDLFDDITHAIKMAILDQHNAKDISREDVEAAIEFAMTRLYDENNINENFKKVKPINEESSTPETPEENGVSYHLIKLIKDEWEAIQGYNDFLQFLRDSHNSEDIIKVIEDITGEENLHVGQLQTLMRTVAPNTDNIREGELEAEEQLDSSSINGTNNESLNETWTEVKSKQIKDFDGFLTDYTMYKNDNGSKYIFMFGDKDYEEPNEEYADWEAETEKEANDWFNSYKGFEDQDDEDYKDDIQQPEKPETWIYNGEEIPKEYKDSIKNVIVEDGVTEIISHDFAGCKSLESITIPNSVTEIEEYAFWGCESLKSVTIPNSVTMIEEYAFGYCKSLESVTISNSVTRINAGTFTGCESLKSVTIPDGVKRIEYQAFSNCTSLESVRIPNRVKEIGNHAFWNCTSLKNVFYSGTRREWNSIAIWGSNEPLFSANLL